MNLMNKFYKKIKGFMLKNMHGMITCKEFDDFVQSYLDEELPDYKRTLFDRHLRMCRECREYLTAYKRTIEVGNAVLHTDNKPVSKDTPEGLIKAILDARKQTK